VSDKKPVSIDGKLLEPVVAHGLQTMSLGFLVDEKDATVWRGPMASRALGQLIFETQWPALDYLIVDMPPGTGDIQLTMSSSVPVSGAIIVTTPQNLALKDAQKGISMFNKVNVPVIGVVENMSFHECLQCGHHSHIFGQCGGDDLAIENSVPLLGKLPLSSDIGRDIEQGRPTLISQPDSTASLAYLAIAQQCAINLNKTNLSIPSLIIGE
jgi:ATP-binding protein involved in chromosome partitioning